MSQQHLALLEEYLRTAPFHKDDVFETVLGGAHSGKVKLILEGAVGVIVKPEGTAENSLAVPREEAGYIVAREMGLAALVAPTVQRVLSVGGTEVKAAVQILWGDASPDQAVQATDFDDQQVWDAAVFDVVVNHTDHGHNFSAAPWSVDRPWRLRLYDNGYAFDIPSRGFDSAFFRLKEGEPIPADLLDRLGRLVKGAPASTLCQVLGDQAYEAVLARAEALLERRRLTNPAELLS